MLSKKMISLQEFTNQTFIFTAWSPYQWTNRFISQTFLFINFTLR